MSQAIEAEINVATRLIDRHVQANLGHKRAIEYGDKHYSYYDLAALANRAGNLLKALGLRQGERLFLLLPVSPAFVGALTGALKVGVVPVVVDRPDDAQAVDACKKSAPPAAVLVHASHLAALAGVLGDMPKDRVVVVGDAPAGYPSFLELMRGQPSSLAPQPLAAAAAGMMVAGGKGSAALSHGQLDALLDGSGDGGFGGMMEMMRALAKAETVQLR